MNAARDTLRSASREGGLHVLIWSWNASATMRCAGSRTSPATSPTQSVRWGGGPGFIFTALISLALDIFSW